MKYIASALVLLAFLGHQDSVNAIRIKSKFTDDLVKSLAEEMNKDLEDGQNKEEDKPQAAAQNPQPANATH